MVEMTEAANILNNASARSLVLMDEIGRGTSTFDGLSLAWACAQHLLQNNRALTLFATHYFELTSLASDLDGAINVHIDAIEHNDEIVFLHSVKAGPANQSYGLQVAQLAGVPKAVIHTAKQRLRQLESQALANTAASVQSEMPLIIEEKPATAASVQRLSEINPDDLTPKQALEILYELKRLDQE